MKVHVYRIKYTEYRIKYFCDKKINNSQETEENYYIMF